MSIIGYGEDALCYWALSHRLHEIAGAADATVLYRPSFGRRGSTPEKPSKQFGEFDAIIAARKIHLVEAKWQGSSEIRGGEIKLRDEQIRRHDIFRAYLEAWWAFPVAEGWASFYRRTKGKRTVGGTDYPLPEVGDKLATNLKAVLDKLGKVQRDVESVLLYLALKNEPISVLHAPGFRVVTIEAESEHSFVNLPGMTATALRACMESRLRRAVGA